jgi:hypothetical protein
VLLDNTLNASRTDAVYDTTFSTLIAHTRMYPDQNCLWNDFPQLLPRGTVAHAPSCDIDMWTLLMLCLFEQICIQRVLDSSVYLADCPSSASEIVRRIIAAFVLQVDASVSGENVVAACHCAKLL